MFVDGLYFLICLCLDVFCEFVSLFDCVFMGYFMFEALTLPTTPIPPTIPDFYPLFI